MGRSGFELEMFRASEGIVIRLYREEELEVGEALEMANLSFRSSCHFQRAQELIRLFRSRGQE